MSIVSEIERIKTNIANAYAKCEEKGATMPSVLNSANLFDCIASITGGAVPTKVLSYFGTATPLSSGRKELAGSSVNGNALFGGGAMSGSNAGSSYVDKYDSNLVKGMAASLSKGRRLIKASMNDNYALFCGGSTSGGSNTSVNNVDAYDSSLVKTTATNLSVARNFFFIEPCTQLDKYAIVGPGLGTNGSPTSTIDAYDDNLVLTTIQLSKAKFFGGVTSLAGKGLFAGGTDYVKEVEVYDKTLTKLTSTELSVGRRAIGAIHNSKLAIFAGGFIDGTIASKIVETFDENLVRGTTADLLTARWDSAVVSTNLYGVIAGGITEYDSGNESATVEAFSTNGVKTVLHDLVASKRHLASAVIENKILFGGGQTSSSVESTIDVFELVG